MIMVPVQFAGLYIKFLNHTFSYGFQIGHDFGRLYDLFSPKSSAATAAISSKFGQKGRFHILSLAIKGLDAIKETLHFKQIGNCNLQEVGLSGFLSNKESLYSNYLGKPQIVSVLRFVENIP